MTVMARATRQVIATIVGTLAWFLNQTPDVPRVYRVATLAGVLGFAGTAIFSVAFPMPLVVTLLVIFGISLCVGYGGGIHHQDLPDDPAVLVAVVIVGLLALAAKLADLFGLW